MQPLPYSELIAMKWEPAPPLELAGLRFNGKCAELPLQGEAVGVDPGRRMGVAWITGGLLFAYSGSLSETRSGNEAIGVGRAIADAMRFGAAVLEDAAPSKNYYQVPLAEIRFGLKIGMEQGGLRVILLRPNSVRKRALGGGLLLATDAWPPLTEHAADAAACALAALYSTDG